MKNPLTPSGIEPATFRFASQHINHCATAGHSLDDNDQKFPSTQTTIYFKLIYVEWTISPFSRLPKRHSFTMAKQCRGRNMSASRRNHFHGTAQVFVCRQQHETAQSIHPVSGLRFKPTYFLTPWSRYSSDANRFSARQISRILWSQKVHYRVYNSSPPVPTLSQMI